MLRPFLLVAGAAALVLVDSAAVWAADGEGGAAAWPALNFSRGTGDYLSPWKIMGCWVMFLLWVRTTDWVNQDAQQLKLKYAMWNPIVYFSFLFALVLFWLLPSFVAGIILMFIAWVVPLGFYVRHRNQVAQNYEKVLTLSHIKQWLGKRLAVIGIKLEGADVDPRDMGPDIKLSPLGGADEATNQVNLLTARQSPGWMPTRELLDDALRQRATHVMLDYTAEATNIRYQIDGAWLDRAPVERAIGDPMLEVLKGLAALNVKDRRKRQAGMLAMEAEKRKFTCNLTSQGTQTGERALLQFVSKKGEFSALEELGMRPKMIEQLDALLDQNGVFVFSSLPAGGLTTTMDMVIAHSDRFVRSFVAVADESVQDREIENVPVTTFSGAAGETPLTVLPRLIRTYPDVIIVRDVADLETLILLCEQVELSRMVMISVRARECVEALLRVLMLKIPPADFAAVVTGVLNARLVRKLCETCKEAYPPPPQVLKQLGLPAGRIENLYRPPSGPIDPKHPEVVCEQCNGIGYYGRTGIFELLSMDDDLRQVLATTPKLDALRAAARKAKHRTLQDEGVLLVAKGITSIQELARVLKQQLERTMPYFSFVLVAIFFVVAALLYGSGLWSNTITLINALTAGLLATNYYEPLATWLDKQEPRLTFAYDFLALWLIFAVSFALLRVMTDKVSTVKVKFFKPVEVAGSVLMAAWVSWVFLCFATMTMHTAPLSRNFFLGGFQEWPESKMMFRAAPDRKWLSWVHRQSQGSFSRMQGTVPFDPRGDFILRYGNRREAFANQMTFTAPKGAAPPAN